MFDIGFPELLLLSVVALLVIGPERLPETIRTVSLWINRFRRSLNSIKAEIEAEIGADEIKKQIQNDEIMQELRESREQLDGMVSNTKSTIQKLDDSAKELTSIPTEPQRDEREQEGNG